MGVTNPYMQPVATIVAFGRTPSRAAEQLDATALASDVLLDGDDLFSRIKRAEAGSLSLLLMESTDDPALAAATKAASILRRRGGGEAAVVLPSLPARPGPRARARLERAAQETGACVMQPIHAASWNDAVRCIVEPLAVFGLIGVDPREIHGLLRTRVALLHVWDDDSLDGSLRHAQEVLVSCRLRPSATLREVDARVARVRSATSVRLVLAGPEVPRDEGPEAIAAVFL
jgi:hypothetical protein